MSNHILSHFVCSLAVRDKYLDGEWH